MGTKKAKKKKRIPHICVYRVRTRCGECGKKWTH